MLKNCACLFHSKIDLRLSIASFCSFRLFSYTEKNAPARGCIRVCCIFLQKIQQNTEQKIQLIVVQATIFFCVETIFLAIFTLFTIFTPSWLFVDSFLNTDVNLTKSNFVCRFLIVGNVCISQFCFPVFVFQCFGSLLIYLS